VSKYLARPWSWTASMAQLRKTSSFLL
jgi:hypothetical protein